MGKINEGTIVVDHEQLEHYVKKHYDTQLSLFVWGTTGIGKSESAEKFARTKAKEMNREFIKWNKLSLTEKKKNCGKKEKCRSRIMKKIEKLRKQKQKLMKDLKFLQSKPYH